MFMKSAADVLVAPGVAAMLLAAGGGALWLVGRRRSGRVVLLCTALVAYLSSIPLVGEALLRPLENRYPPLDTERLPVVGYIVVLGSGYDPADGIPVTAALDDDGLVRLVEGVRLARLLPAARLVLSGGGRPDHPPIAQGYARLALALGVTAQSLILSDRPLDTHAEATEVSKIVGHAPFLLVTSASHMPRAMLLMRRAGTNPIAAPTAQHAYRPFTLVWRAFTPSAGGLRDTEQALHEFAGLAAIACGWD
jgi:uncharacterized SAM-binding protein YcdF (DUF218 family)